MYEVGVVGQFEAAHRLQGDFGPATRLHGHTYRVEVSVSGERLGDDGTLLDLARLRTTVDDVCGELHCHDLDEVPGLTDANTTAERVAEHISAAVAKRLTAAPAGGQLLVRVWESPAAFAAHRRALTQ